MKLAYYLIVAPLYLLSACVATVPLNPIKYDSTTTVTSTKEASLLVTTGIVNGGLHTTTIAAGGVYLPMTVSEPAQHFLAKDQQVFGDYLRAELVRLGILRSASPPSGADKDLQIHIFFAETFHKPSFHVYTLDVEMKIAGGPQHFSKRYRVDSSEEDSTVQKMMSTAWSGKDKAGKLLMKRLIPDIEAYVATLKQL